MKTLNTLMRCALVVLLVAATADAQTNKAGLTGASFLKIDVGAREAALATAVTGLTGDANLMFYNPAGIALKDQMGQVSFNYNKWIADLGHNSIAVTYNWEDIGTFGLGFLTFGVNDIVADRDVYTDPVLAAMQIDQNTSATYNYRDMAFQLSYARYVMDNFSIGVTVKGVFETVDGTSISAFAVDFGSVYNIGLMDWTIAARFNNLGSDMKYYDIPFGLPLTFAIGTAITPVKMEQGKLMVSVDAVKGQDGPQYIFAGGELTLLDVVALRGGYKFNYTGKDDGGTSSRTAIDNTIEGFTAGAGVTGDFAGLKVGVDYAFTKMELLDNVHRFSLKIGLK
jgi:hypothetical protein